LARITREQAERWFCRGVEDAKEHWEERLAKHGRWWDEVPTNQATCFTDDMLRAAEFFVSPADSRPVMIPDVIVTSVSGFFWLLFGRPLKRPEYEYIEALRDEYGRIVVRGEVIVDIDLDDNPEEGD